MQIDPEQPFIMVYKNILTPQECKALIHKIEDLGPTLATINTAIGHIHRPQTRNNDRVIFDDQALADEVFSRIKSSVPQDIHGMQLLNANERFRCYRYKPGQRFAPHRDGSFERSGFERSYYSFLLYLNEDFEGGETKFLTDPEKSIKPETGMALLFQHPLIHEGAEVTKGVKYVARTDLMYVESGALKDQEYFNSIEW